jgi:Bacterial transglutaminase-like cysteine proteinase BTLCP
LIAEIIPGAYDAVGRKDFRPDLRRKGLRPTAPMGSYLTHPLSIECKTIRDIRKFLSTCKGVSDKELFGKDEFWQPPEDFEKTRKGDCDDFALWTWRQFLALGYDARFVAGRHGRYGTGHAWVAFEKDGKHYLVEPQFRGVGDSFPRLSTLNYHPKFSVAWDGAKLSFYRHQDLAKNIRIRQLPLLLLDWLIGWGFYWFTTLPRIPYWLMRRAIRKLTRSAGTPPSVP